MAETEKSFLGSENMNMTVEANFFMEHTETPASLGMRSCFILSHTHRSSTRHQYDCMNSAMSETLVSQQKVKAIPVSGSKDL
jgi:hypothetical protein